MQHHRARRLYHTVLYCALLYCNVLYYNRLHYTGSSSSLLEPPDFSVSDFFVEGSLSASLLAACLLFLSCFVCLFCIFLCLVFSLPRSLRPVAGQIDAQGCRRGAHAINSGGSSWGFSFLGISWLGTTRSCTLKCKLEQGSRRVDAVIGEQVSDQMP